MERRTYIQSQVLGFVAEHYHRTVEELSLEMRWQEDLGSSLDVIEIFMACEERFGIEMSEEDMEKLPTIGDLIDYVVNNPLSRIDT